MGAEEVYWENYLVLVIDRIVRSMRAVINDDIADLGITSAQAPYLLALHIKDGQPMASLSTFLEMDRANTSRMIKSLQEMGMITTERPINNSRNVPVLLTAHGREVAEDLFDRMVALNRSFFAGISDKDFLRLRNTATCTVLMKERLRPPHSTRIWALNQSQDPNHLRAVATHLGK